MSSDVKSRRLSRGTWWTLGLAAAALAMVVAVLVAVLKPSGRSGSSWDSGFGWPGLGGGWGAYGATAYDVVAFGEALQSVDDLLGPDAGIRSVYIDDSGYGFVDACNADGQTITLSVESWEPFEIDPDGAGCPALLTVSDINLAAVEAALQDAAPYRGAWVEVSIGYLWGLVEPAEEPYIMVSIDEWDQMVYTMDGEYLEFIAGSGYTAGVPMSPEDASTALEEILAASDLATASSMCWDGDYEWYMVVGQRADDAGTSYEWAYDGEAWEMDAWSTGGPAPLPVAQMDLPGAIARIDELKGQWQHNFPVTSVCLDVVASDTYQITYRGYAAGAQRTVTTDADGVILQQS